MSLLRAKPLVESDFAEFLQTTQVAVRPDSCYGVDQGFEHVLNLIEEASEGLMKFFIQKVHA
jgi:protein-tyrosine phosphatase